MANRVEHIDLAGVEMNGEFPFMNAAGSVNGAGEENFWNDFNDVVRAPGAAIMIGSVTVAPKEGNEPAYGGPVYRHVTETGLTYNSMGLPNLGIDRVMAILPDLVGQAHDNDKRLAVSLAPLTASPGPEWAEMAVKALWAGADIIEFNAGCPNIYDEDGNPKTVLSLVPDALGEALEYVQDRLGSNFPSGVKLSPAPVEGFSESDGLSAESPLIVAQAEVMNALDIAKYVAYFNTFGGQVPTDKGGKELPLSVPGGAGGVSGPGVARVARAQTDAMLGYLNDDIDVVVAGGITTGEDLMARIESDPRVKLGSAVTALWEASSMGIGITRIAEEYAEVV